MLDSYSSERIFTEIDNEDDVELQDSKCSKIRCSGFSCTMEVLSMIKNTIIAEDSNPIARYFEIGRHVGSCGPEMVWKIFDAVRIDDKKEASVFIFEKKIADKLHKPRRRETVSEILRKEVQYLQKIKHPKILTVIHPLEESSNSLAFASEPVLTSLANLIGNCERMPTPIPPEIKEYEFLEHEIKYGIIQITEALSYLHGCEQLLHKNVCPASILVTKKGSWKLGGLGFAERLKDGKESVTCHAWSTKMSKMAQPDLNYVAPEVQVSKTSSYLSDMFSLGMVICTIHNDGFPLLEADHSPSQYLKQLDQIKVLQDTSNNLFSNYAIENNHRSLYNKRLDKHLSYSSKLSQKFGEVAHKMPLQLVEPVEKMINKDIRYRPTAQLFSLLKFFNDPVVNILQHLDVIEYRDPAQRHDIFTSLAQVVPSIPKKILYRHVFPQLCLECSSPDTITSALCPMLTMIDYATRDEYFDIILPKFRDIINEPKPTQATVYILDKLDIVLAKSPVEEIRCNIIPFVFNCLESNSIQAQEGALNAIGIVKGYLDDSIMRGIVLPRAKTLYHKANTVKIRINALRCIDHLLDSLNKMIILDEVLPFLTEISSFDPDIVMSVVGIYKHMLSDRKFGLTHNLIATKVMPPLIPHTVNPGLNLEQFSALMEVLREMLEQINRKRRDKMKEETVTEPVPHRGSINMFMDGKMKDEKGGLMGRNYLSVDDAVQGGIQKSRTEQNISSLVRRDRPRHSPSPSAPNSPDHHAQHAKSLQEEKTHLLKEKTMENQRKFSLVPPASGTPGISLIADESPCSDRPRRPSTQSLGQYTFPVSWFYDYRRGSSDSSRRSSDKPRRPSTHSVGILPISMFGEGGEKPRKPSTHSLGILPLGYEDENGFDRFDRHRRPSAGPFVTPDFDRRGSRGSLFGFADSVKGQPRRASFQALGESVMQLFSGKQ